MRFFPVLLDNMLSCPFPRSRMPASIEISLKLVVCLYRRSSFWNSANDLRSQVGSGQRLVCCDSAGERTCPNGYGRIEQDDGENHQPPAGKSGGVPCVLGRSGKYGVQQLPESRAVQPQVLTQPDLSVGAQLRGPCMRNE